MHDNALRKMPGHLIRRLHQQSTAVFIERLRLAGYDITSVQFAAMQMLHDASGLDQAGLAKSIAYDRATIGGVVKRLESKGLITRKTSETDRRAFNLWLSPKGSALLAGVRPVVINLQDQIMPNLSDQERDLLLSLMEKALRREPG